MLAADLTTGTLIPLPVTNRAGLQCAGRIQQVRSRRNGAVFVWARVLHGPDEGHVRRVRFSGRDSITPLTRHYGVCLECGALAPCPEQVAELHSRQLLADADPFVPLMRASGLERLTTALRGASRQSRPKQ